MVRKIKFFQLIIPIFNLSSRPERSEVERSRDSSITVGMTEKKEIRGQLLQLPRDLIFFTPKLKLYSLDYRPVSPVNKTKSVLTLSIGYSQSIQGKSGRSVK